MRRRFGATVRAAVHGELAWATDEDVRALLAMVVCLDQYTRHAFRGTPAAFAGDEKAAALVLDALEAGRDVDLDPGARMVLYQPLMHAEEMVVQDLGIDVARSMVRDARDDDELAAARGYLSFMEDHAAVVHRFGRFPDRNRILGRATTEEEARFLATEHRGWFEERSGA